MTEQATLSREAVIAQGEGQVSTFVDDKAVLMSVDNGKYYSLDDIGSRIWALIESPTSVGAVCDQLTQEFEVERATCEADVLALLNKLLGYDLIRVVPS
ncbi:MAG TPA: lasso peptide biosynthesis PqqD family chaperone [Gemmataceae bacterium]|nr:lasso peptide biosynthesis PqqD family chaperone [Gemmataceae bacterium]